MLSTFFFAIGEIDIALPRYDGLSCSKVPYVRCCEIASASIQVSPCTSLHTMIIIRVELDRDSKRIGAIGHEWFHVIAKHDGSSYTVYSL